MQVAGSEMLPSLLSSAHNILLFLNAQMHISKSCLEHSALNKEQQSHYQDSVKTAVKDVPSAGKIYA